MKIHQKGQGKMYFDCLIFNLILLSMLPWTFCPISENLHEILTLKNAINV